MSGPGKFQGEADWVAYFWEDTASLADPSNEYTTGDGFYVAVELTDDDKKKYPKIKDEYGVILSEDTQGFVTAELYEDKKEYDDAVSELEEIQTDYLGEDGE